jgi:hypothetical protein
MRDVRALGPLLRVRAKSSTAIVRAYIADEDGVIVSRDGQLVPYRAGGHYIIAAARHHCHPVPRTIFEATHRAVGPGQYCKRTDVVLRAVTAPFEVEIITTDGVVHAGAGDWIMIGPAGVVWPVPADHARETYTPVISATGVASLGSLAMTAAAGLAAWTAMRILNAPVTQIATLGQ